MGLDMWLYVNSRKVAEEINDQSDEWEGGFQTPRGIAVSWRKANAIHRWFVDNIQHGNDDCGLYEVEIEDLVRLHDTCREVLDSTELVDGDIASGMKFDGGEWVANMVKGQKLADPSRAMELLPTQEGFFFGSIEYDQYYWWDIWFTAEKLGKIIDMLKPVDNNIWHVVHKDEPEWFVRFYYKSSW